MDATTAPSTLPASSVPSGNAASIGGCYIDRLPIELLAAILEEHSVQEAGAPFIDSQVCHRWHETAQRWPRAWSYITIRSITDTEYEKPLNRVKTMLERSCDRPLHLYLHYSHSMSGPITMLLFQRPAITRIQTLLLMGSLPDTIRMMEGIPNLRSLQLWQCIWRGDIKFRLGTENFPLLDELVAHFAWSLPHLAVRSPVLLRKIYFSYIDDVMWAKILSGCRETLVEVSLSDCVLPPPSQIHLPKLKFLALSNMLDFRNNIVAPGLITFLEHEPLDPLDPLKLPHTFSSVTEYAHRGPCTPMGDEPRLEEHVLPKLERLALRSTWEGIREVLWRLVSYPHAVPKLNTIRLATEDGDDLSDAQWAELEKLFAHTPLSSTLKRRIVGPRTHLSAFP
jgi:hypothetical protein